MGYHPILDKLYVAEKGKGTFLNSRQLHVQRTQSHVIVSVIASFPTSAQQAEVAHRLYGKVYRTLTNWSCALDFCLLAESKLDVLISLNGGIEDHAAGIIIAKEAGAHFSTVDGKPFSFHGFSRYCGWFVAGVSNKVISLVIDAARLDRLHHSD